jgi:hypothetical protein
MNVVVSFQVPQRIALIMKQIVFITDFLKCCVLGLLISFPTCCMSLVTVGTCLQRSGLRLCHLLFWENVNSISEHALSRIG